MIRLCLSPAIPYFSRLFLYFTRRKLRPRIFSSTSWLCSSLQRCVWSVISPATCCLHLPALMRNKTAKKKSVWLYGWRIAHVSDLSLCGDPEFFDRKGIGMGVVSNGGRAKQLFSGDHNFGCVSWRYRENLFGL